MKFGKTLEEALTPEWRAKFIDYKGLKKKIKVCAEIAIINSASPSPEGSATPFPQTPQSSLVELQSFPSNVSSSSSSSSSSNASAAPANQQQPRRSSSGSLSDITPSVTGLPDSKTLEIRMISYSSGRSDERGIVNDVADTISQELRISGHGIDDASPDIGESPAQISKQNQKRGGMRRTSSGRHLPINERSSPVYVDSSGESEDEDDDGQKRNRDSDNSEEENEDDDDNAENEEENEKEDIQGAAADEEDVEKGRNSMKRVSSSPALSTSPLSSAVTLDRLVVLHKQAKRESITLAQAQSQSSSPNSSPKQSSQSMLRDIMKKKLNSPPPQQSSPSAPPPVTAPSSISSLSVIIPPASSSLFSPTIVQLPPPLPSGSSVDDLPSHAKSGGSVEDVLIDVKTALSNPTPSKIPRSISNLNFAIPASITTEQAEHMFVDALKREMAKINDFYHTQESKSVLRLDDLRQQAKQMRLLIKQGQSIEKAQTHQLRAAFQEFFRGVSLMKNFSLLNFTGFVKILKKYDKNTKRRLHDTFMDTVREQPFVLSPMLEKLEKDTHSIFAKLFCQGDKRKAMDLLRVSVREKSVEEDVIYRSGLWLGACVPLVVFIMSEYFQYFANSSSMPSHVVISWNIYKLAILPILMLGCWALNILIWQRAHINFVFIFELNNRVHLHSYDYFELSARLLVLWLVSVFFYMETTISEMRGFSSMFVIGIPAYLHPFILLGMLLSIVFCPFNLFYKAARKWLLWELFKILTAPLYAVRFADFFLADQLTSLGEFLFDFQFLICALNAELKGQNAQSFCTSSGFAVAAPILTSLPFWARFWQCIRRYRDNGQVHPNLTNAGKYASHLLMLCFAFADSMLTKPGHFGGWKVLWLITNLASTIYKGAWDFKMDWGLLEKGCKVPLLRKKRVFRQKAFYYFAMVNNVLLRLVWLALFIAKMGFDANTRKDWISFLVAVLEIFRRFVWNIFRLEHEQVHNTESYRATVDVPLPFTVGKSTSHEHLIARDDDKSTSKANLLMPAKDGAASVFSRVLNPMSDGIRNIMQRTKRT